MKLIATLALALTGLQASAAEISCWNLYAKRGAPPAFTANLNVSNYLYNVKMIQKEGPFGEFDISDVQEEVQGVNFDRKRSPYDGLQKFDLTADTDIQLILPRDLSPEALKATQITAGNLPEDLMKRQNGVIEVAGNRHGSGGSIFIRMHCVSKVD